MKKCNVSLSYENTISNQMLGIYTCVRLDFDFHPEINLVERIIASRRILHCSEAVVKRGCQHSQGKGMGANRDLRSPFKMNRLGPLEQ